MAVARKYCLKFLETYLVYDVADISKYDAHLSGNGIFSSCINQNAFTNSFENKVGMTTGA